MDFIGDSDFVNTDKNTIKKEIIEKLNSGDKKLINTISFDDCVCIVNEYNTKEEFIRDWGKLYEYVKKMHWTSKLLSFLNSDFKKKRCIYAYEFRDIDEKNYVYVGLTYNLKTRHSQHKSGTNYSSVYEFCKMYNIEMPTPIQLTDYIDVFDSIEAEVNWLQKYIQDNCLPINKAPTGSVGGCVCRDFDIEYAKTIISKYNTLNDFRKQEHQLYVAIKDNNLMYLLDGLYRIKEDKKITFEKCIENAKKCRTYSEFHELYRNYDDWFKENGYNIKDFVDFEVVEINKPIYQIDPISKEVIQKFDNINDIYKLFKDVAVLSHFEKTIRLCCCGSLSTGYGYIWSYTPNVETDTRIDVSINQYTLDNELIRTWNNKIEIKQAGFLISKVIANCNGKIEKYDNCIWKYVDEEYLIKEEPYSDDTVLYMFNPFGEFIGTTTVSDIKKEHPQSWIYVLKCLKKESLFSLDRMYNTVNELPENAKPIYRFSRDGVLEKVYYRGNELNNDGFRTDSVKNIIKYKNMFHHNKFFNDEPIFDYRPNRKQVNIYEFNEKDEIVEIYKNTKEVSVKYKVTIDAVGIWCRYEAKSLFGHIFVRADNESEAIKKLEEAKDFYKQKKENSIRNQKYMRKK